MIQPLVEKPVSICSAVTTQCTSDKWTNGQTNICDSIHNACKQCDIPIDKINSTCTFCRLSCVQTVGTNCYAIEAGITYNKSFTLVCNTCLQVCYDITIMATFQFCQLTKF